MGLRESYQNAETYAQYTQLSQDLEDRDSWQTRTHGTKRMRRRPKQLTVEVLAQIASAYSAGATLRELVEEYGVNRERLALMLIGNDRSLRPRGPNSKTHSRDEKGRYLPRTL